MGETEESKIIAKRVIKSRVAHKAMNAIAASTIREIVRKANEKEIRHEDVVSLVRDGNQFVLVYYF